MVSSCLFRWAFTCQTLAVNARNRAKTTRFKSDVLEAPVILVPDKMAYSVPKQGPGLGHLKLRLCVLSPSFSALRVVLSTSAMQPILGAAILQATPGIDAKPTRGFFSDQTLRAFIPTLGWLCDPTRKSPPATKKFV